MVIGNKGIVADLNNYPVLFYGSDNLENIFVFYGSNIYSRVWDGHDLVDQFFWI